MELIDNADSNGFGAILRERRGEVATAIEAGMKCAGVSMVEIGGVPHAIVPAGVSLKKKERLLPHPIRVRAEHVFEEPGSFCNYVKIFRAAGTRLYGWLDSFTFRAVLDDHTADQAQWGDHVAEIQLRASPEWDAWMKACSGALSQQDLADFLEDHLEQIASPDASDVLTDIRHIHVTSNTRCESVQREGGDIAFTLATETSAGTKTERGRIPSKLVLMIAPFRSWDPVQMTVNLTYSLNREKGLFFSMRPHRSEERR